MLTRKNNATAVFYQSRNFDNNFAVIEMYYMYLYPMICATFRKLNNDQFSEFIVKFNYLHFYVVGRKFRLKINKYSVITCPRRFVNFGSFSAFKIPMNNSM